MFSLERKLIAVSLGFHSGNFLFRGYFNGSATGVNISVQGYLCIGGPAMYPC